MKKILLITSLLVLAGCAEKQEYEQVLLEKMKLEKDIKDYKIDPDSMAKCVSSKTSSKMPGIFPGDPRRITAYRNYIKMITLTESADPKKNLGRTEERFWVTKGIS